MAGSEYDIPFSITESYMVSNADVKNRELFMTMRDNYSHFELFLRHDVELRINSFESSKVEADAMEKTNSWTRSVNFLDISLRCICAVANMGRIVSMNTSIWTSIPYGQFTYLHWLFFLYTVHTVQAK